MAVALLIAGGYPAARGEPAAWCDRLLRQIADHEVELCVLSRSARQAVGPRRPLPPHVLRVRTAPLWGPPPDCRAGRSSPGSASHLCAVGSPRLSRRYAACFAELTVALCHRPGSQEDRFATGLYGLAELAVEHGGAARWLRSEQAVRVLAAACRAPGAPRAVQAARAADLRAVTERLERVLRPLSLDWYGRRDSGDRGLAAAGLCHAVGGVGGDLAVLPGLVARHLFGTPLLVTEWGVPHHRDAVGDPGGAAHAVAPSAAGAPVRALLAAFRARLAREAYARAALVTPGDARYTATFAGFDRIYRELLSVPGGPAGFSRSRAPDPHPDSEPGPHLDPEAPTPRPFARTPLHRMRSTVS